MTPRCRFIEYVSRLLFSTLFSEHFSSACMILESSVLPSKMGKRVHVTVASPCTDHRFRPQMVGTESWNMARSRRLDFCDP